jgi:ligand-binding sensor domain-containing protein/signal transduction histidine kinase
MVARAVDRLGGVFLLGIVLYLAASGSVLADDPHRPQTLRFNRLGTDQGLSDATVEAVFQDHRGFIWVGTADGLNRYDGYGFKVYKPDEEDPGSISGAYIWDVFEDSAGVLWVGTSLGVNRYVRETDSFVSYRHDPENPTSLSLNTVQDILEDARGEIWVATGGGLNRLDRASDTFVRFEHDPEDPRTLSDDNVQVLFEDSAGRFWVGTQGGLNRLEGEGFVHYLHDPEDANSLSHNYIRAIEEDRFGYLWIGTEDGLNRFHPDEPDRVERFRHDPQNPQSIRDNQVWSVYEDRRGVLWVGTDRGGLAFLDREREAFVHYQHDPGNIFSISSDVVYVILEDTGGNLWTGNYAGGVNFIDRGSMAFDFYTHIPGDAGSLNHKSVLSFLEDQRDEIWVGTEDGLARFDREQGNFRRYRHTPGSSAGPTAPAVLSLHEDPDGTIWVGTYNGGLNRFDSQTGTFVRLRLDDEDSPSAEKAQIWTLEIDRRGLLWVGTASGLYRVDRATGESTLFRADFGNPDALGHDYVWKLYEDRQGRIWAGTHDGLSLFVPEDETFVTFRHDPEDPTSLSFNQVVAIHEDDQGRLWLGTHGGGLNRFDPELRTATAYRVENGLPNDVVLTVTGSAGTGLWLGTNRGLSLFDPYQKTFTNFDHNDGLQGRQFNRGAALSSRRGELLFGGINGFNLFRTEDIEVNTEPPPVVFTGFRIFNEVVAVSADGPLKKQVSEVESITLRHDQSVLSFDFAALNYRNAGRNRYAYKLEGFDSDWIQAGTARSATYTNLDPGHYTLRVRGSNNSGVWNEEGASVRLHILPPFWATWWFRLTVLVTLGGMVFAAYYVRIWTMRRHNEELQAEIVVRRQVEHERSRLLQEMESKNITLERQNAQLERFAYTVSHDLKSPLVTIRGFLGLLQRDAESEDRERLRDDISQIERAASTMSRLLDDVLELSRVGRVANPTEEIALGDLAHQACDLLHGAEGQTAAEIDIDSRMPTVVGDRMRLLEVYQNLLENALKFSGDQDEPRVEVGAIERDGQVDCFVRDNGAGVAPQYQEKIFGLFEQLDRAGGGTGIGLTLVKRIVEVHGGEVWVDSEGDGRGSTFWFSLPLTGGSEGSAS